MNNNSKSYLYVLILIFISLTDVYAFSWKDRGVIEHPEDNFATKERIELGKLLFFDKRLSSTDSISCATCHRPELAWTDGREKALGVNNKKGSRNTPTIVNSAYQKSYMWDGRAKTLEEQVILPIVNNHEMNMPIDEMVKKIQNINGYKVLFDKAYNDEGITKETIAKAIASFERTIVSKNSIFDRWISDKNSTAFTTEAQEGFILFKEKGRCVSCHGGPNFTRGNFENVGLGDSDPGVYGLNKISIWYGTFKTPTLREITKTAPYFHDGSVHTLEESVHICGNGGRFNDARKSPFFRDRDISTKEMYKIVTFLKTLETQGEAFIVPTEFPN